MAGLTAKFSLIGEMSDKLSGIADKGQSMIERWEQVGEAASSAIDGIACAAAQTASSIDGVSTSLSDLQNSAGDAGTSANSLSEALNNYESSIAEAVEETNNWTTAAQSYDKAALETVYSAEEEEAESGGQKGSDAIEAIASALTDIGIIAFLKESTQSVYELANAFSEAEKVVVNATGAYGEALEQLESSMISAYSGHHEDLNATAGAIGEINTRMGLTGDALTEVTGLFLDYASITGSDVVGSVQNVTKVMNQWGVEMNDVESVLDKLAYAGQISGASVTALAARSFPARLLFRKSA